MNSIHQTAEKRDPATILDLALARSGMPSKPPQPEVSEVIKVGEYRPTMREIIENASEFDLEVAMRDLNVEFLVWIALVLATMACFAGTAATMLAFWGAFVIKGTLFHPMTALTTELTIAAAFSWWLALHCGSVIDRHRL